ncbi:TetR/AcrR family transcriptional regulator [Paracoccus benzoatiresistens]|uniref:TetR/AcrR family transcriptional regulator n=1 Tax=Paracoccus benzoatiresistens TaxID=2997341 RepID=A0ABT4J618_9RHOB|nr:TetR/AcrR family transcriptional regulator [Paracoccus sp. EF6]MCZ0962568.1 TetR/AcrR family transcriptional regulator [Paracoccus sp. EF6]
MPARGELPRALIEAGLALLDEEGTEGLTLRRVAARAGVSHAAPAHHFDGLPGLKTAIATRGFQSFLHDLAAARDNLPEGADAFDALLAVNLAYIHFAGNRTALFRLMLDQLPTRDAELRNISNGSYLVLKEVCAPFTANRPAAALEAAVWALTHGYASLTIGKTYLPEAQVRTCSYEEALRLLVG